MSNIKIVLGALLVGVVLQAPVVHAQDEHDNAPCKADREKFCKDAQPGKGAIFQCLKQHEAELSDSCKAAVQRHPGHGHHRGGADGGT
jgi:hypothetical protein